LVDAIALGLGSDVRHDDALNVPRAAGRDGVQTQGLDTGRARRRRPRSAATIATTPTSRPRAPALGVPCPIAHDPPLVVLVTTHALIDVSQTAGAWQSVDTAHCFWQVPLVPQVYGAQVAVVPSRLIDWVPSAEQCELCTHLPAVVSHRNEVAQSSFEAHDVLQVAAAQT
jgi:hypothetical protein